MDIYEKQEKLRQPHQERLDQMGLFATLQDN